MLNIRRGRIAVAIGATLALAMPAAPRWPPTRSRSSSTGIVRGNHAMFFVAARQGFLCRERIEVTDIRKGTGSPDTMRLVANATPNSASATCRRSPSHARRAWPALRSSPVNQRSPLGIISLAQTKVLKSPEDIKGLNIGIHRRARPTSFSRPSLPANGMRESDLKISTVCRPL